MKPAPEHKIFSLSPAEFNTAALDIFHYQYAANRLYRDYVDTLSVNASAVRSIAQIPFLPIRFFKSHEIKTGDFEPAIIFESSGTTGMSHSRHFVKDTALYEESFLTTFNRFYGNNKDYCILGLLPSYLERKNSSLVYMVNEWIRQSGSAHSGFYLDDFDKLADVLKELESRSQQILLIGVSFALLDFAAKHSFPLKHTIIMETGGMKGRREEMVRAELHSVLMQSFSLPAIHSEYGMTELLSQAYSKGEGIFHCPPSMKVLLRDEDDPLTVVDQENINAAGARGAINIIDLANIHSCSFIATDDAGRLYADGSFEVLGRLDNSDIRGCSQLVN